MTMLPQAFDASQVDPTVPFEPLPRGKYLVSIDHSEMKSTKAGDGQFLELRFDVLEGECKNRKVFDRLNLVNKNEKAVEIAYRTLSAICRACGAMQITDSIELHSRPLVIDVTLVDGQKGPQNEIKGYYSVGSATLATAPASAPRAATPAAPPKPAGAPAAAPWKRQAA